MSGLVGLITKNGGALALGRAFAPLATTAPRAQLCAVCAGVAVFFDDYASILIVGICFAVCRQALEPMHGAVLRGIDGARAREREKCELRRREIGNVWCLNRRCGTEKARVLRQTPCGTEVGHVRY
eukprot:3422890-Rhodomonas_salina.1